MLKNVGSADRIIRILAGVIIFALIAAGTLSGTAAIILGILAAVLVITGIMGFCPLYYITKLSTSKDHGKK